MRKVVPLLAKSVKYDVCGTKGLPDSSIAPFGLLSDNVNVLSFEGPIAEGAELHSKRVVA